MLVGYRSGYTTRDLVVALDRASSKIASLEKQASDLNEEVMTLRTETLEAHDKVKLLQDAVNHGATLCERLIRDRDAWRARAAEAEQASPNALVLAKLRDMLQIPANEGVVTSVAKLIEKYKRAKSLVTEAQRIISEE